jgi:hypothetical protein
MILSVIVTAGAPATEAATLAELAAAGGWDVHAASFPWRIVLEHATRAMQ